MTSERINQLLSEVPSANLESELKVAVADSLSKLDKRAVIKATEYFNHTFVPDLVVVWTQIDRRYVYLRPFLEPVRLSDDVRALQEQASPIFYSLREVEAETESRVEEVLASRDRTMATEPKAMDGFHSSTGLLGESLAAAVLHGGRGFVSTGDAEAVVGTTHSFSDDRRGAVEDLVATLRLFDQHLSETDAGRFRRLLNYWWFIRHGEDAPGLLRDGSPRNLSTADMKQLLLTLFDLPPIDTPDVWDRLVAEIDLDLLCDLGHQTASPNLDRLVRECARNLVAQSADVQQYLEPILGDLYWMLNPGFLSLNAERGSLHLRLASRGNRLARTKIGIGPTVETFLARVGDRVLRSIETDQGDFQVRVRVGETVTSQQAVAGAKERLMPRAKVRAAEVMVASTIARIDFERRRLSTTSPLTVQRLALETAELLLGFSDPEMDKLRHFLGQGATVDSVGYELDNATLFDVLEERN